MSSMQRVVMSTMSSNLISSKFHRLNDMNNSTNDEFRNHDESFPSNIHSYSYCGILDADNATSQGRQKCYNASDCVGGRYLRFCNHDYDVFGFCEECKTVATKCNIRMTYVKNNDNCKAICSLEDFVCEMGEKSCNETCIDLVEMEDVATVNLNFPLIIHIAIIVTCLLLITWVALRYVPFLESGSSKTGEQNSDENEKEDFDFDEDNILPVWLQNRKEMIFPESAILRGQTLGKGQFGIVMKGALVQGNAIFPIAIKMSFGQNSKQHEMILEEAKNMIRLTKYHDHIVNLQGLTYTSDKGNKCISSISLLLEYCCKGDLRSFLIRHRLEIEKSLTLYMNSGFFESTKSKSARNVILDVKILYRLVYQISDGMDYLSGQGIYHGDLAARNILLTETLDAKISDFGISHRLYSNLQEPQKLAIRNDEGPVLLPVRWLAYEVLTRYEIVPIKSDVWSFGVTTWEIFSIGRNPYWEGLDVAQLIEGLSLGMRLKTPSLCPKPIGNLIQRCFEIEPDKRPTFKEIKGMLNSSYSELLIKISEMNKKPKDSDETEYLSFQNTSSETLSMKSRYHKVLNANKENQKNEEIGAISVRYFEVKSSENTS